MLFHREKQFLNNISEEGIVFSPRNFAFLKTRVNRKEPSLVQFLRLEKCVNPVLLSFLQEFDSVLILRQLLFIFAEIRRADVLYLVQLFVVNNLQRFSV